MAAVALDDLRAAIADYWPHFVVAGGDTEYSDDRFPSGFIQAFKTKLSMDELEWSVTMGLDEPKAVMKTLFLAEKERRRKSAMKQRKRAQAAAQAASRAAQAEEVLTEEVIQSNLKSMSEAAASSEARRRNASAKKAAALKVAETLRKLKLMSNPNPQAASSASEAKTRAQAAARIKSIEKIRKCIPPSTVFGRKV